MFCSTFLHCGFHSHPLLIVSAIGITKVWLVQCYLECITTTHIISAFATIMPVKQTRIMGCVGSKLLCMRIVSFKCKMHEIHVKCIRVEIWYVIVTVKRWSQVL